MAYTVPWILTPRCQDPATLARVGFGVDVVPRSVLLNILGS